MKCLADARAADAEARTNPPGLAVAGAALAETPGLVRGKSGAGGTYIGRVRIGEVLVARTILPTELPLIAAAALVIETGGPLDHVAAQARERGIPAVVGAVGACDRLRDGDRVLVDGDAGLVVKLGSDD
jgi:phosphohistidine swiveling domain-containing protein